MLARNPFPYPGGAEIDLFLGAEADLPRHRPDRNPALAGLPNSVALRSALSGSATHWPSKPMKTIVALLAFKAAFRHFSIASVGRYIPHEFPPRTIRFSHLSKFRLLCNLS